MSEIYSHFGSPEDIAKTYLTNFLKPVDIRKALDKKRVLIIMAVIVLIILIVALAIALIDGHISNYGYVVEGAPKELLIQTSSLIKKEYLIIKNYYMYCSVVY